MPVALSKITQPTCLNVFFVARLFALFFLLGILALPTPTQNTDETKKKNLLIIYDERDNLPGLAVLDKGIRSGLLGANSFTVDVYSESLDRSRFTGKEYDGILADYFRDKYDGKKLD